MKKIMIGFFLFFFLLFFYFRFLDKKVYYLNLGNLDGYEEEIISCLKEDKVFQASHSFIEKDMRVIDLIHKIEDNEKEEKTSIQNALIKADFVTLSLGGSDFINHIELVDSPIKQEELESYLDQALKSFDTLFQMLRTYCKEAIYVIGYYSPNEHPKNYLLLNERIKKLCETYDITFVSIYELIEENKENFLTDGLINEKGYSAISKEIYIKWKQKFLK